MFRWFLLLTAILALAGCSPTQKIAERANGIAARAREDEAAWGRAEKAHPDLGKEAKAGRKRADADIADVAEIHRQLTGVEDQTPWWASMIVWVAAAAVMTVGFLFLWQSGILSGLRVLVGWIPRRKMSQAEFAVNMLDPDRPESDREFLAALRAQDPVFDAAFRKAQERRKASK
jgi:hypothetical protein